MGFGFAALHKLVKEHIFNDKIFKSFVQYLIEIFSIINIAVLVCVSVLIRSIDVIVGVYVVLINCHFL
jgi:hypothetical protein